MLIDYAATSLPLRYMPTRHMIMSCASSNSAIIQRCYAMLPLPLRQALRASVFAMLPICDDRCRQHTIWCCLRALPMVACLRHAAATLPWLLPRLMLLLFSPYDAAALRYMAHLRYAMIRVRWRHAMLMRHCRRRVAACCRCHAMPLFGCMRCRRCYEPCRCASARLNAGHTMNAHNMLPTTLRSVITADCVCRIRVMSCCAAVDLRVCR